MRGVNVRKTNIEKLMEVLTFALRNDNPSVGFENAFLENYDPPIKFHWYFWRLAHSAMVLLCFFVQKNVAKPLYCVQVYKITNEIEWDGRNFLKMCFQNQRKGCHF